MKNIIVGVVIKKDDKILMVQEAIEKVYGMWNFPMGHLDNGKQFLRVLEGKQKKKLDMMSN